ncbi:MAG: (2Fe-2S)-binding protein [Actinomycetia bacterium]|nr:(2Fe-2S)-binding protein [Actinomycetes bacterium]
MLINGAPATIEVEPRTSLADLIREELGLTGTHLGCEHGVCGACTILVDGEPVRSCLMLGVQADGKNITTIEGLADPISGEMHPIQKGMHEAHGFQCSFCAPGFLMSAVALLEDNPNPTRDQIREELGGNVCRCTGYKTILDGVEAAVSIKSGDNTSSTNLAAEVDR